MQMNKSRSVILHHISPRQAVADRGRIVIWERKLAFMQSVILFELVSNGLSSLGVLSW